MLLWYKLYSQYSTVNQAGDLAVKSLVCPFANSGLSKRKVDGPYLWCEISQNKVRNQWVVYYKDIYGSKLTLLRGRRQRTRAVYVAINPWQQCNDSAARAPSN